MEAALSSGFGYNSIESAVLDKLGQRVLNRQVLFSTLWLGQHHVSKHQLDYDSSYARAADVLVQQLLFASECIVFLNTIKHQKSHF